jgi:hypothetical protein
MHFFNFILENNNILNVDCSKLLKRAITLYNVVMDVINVIKKSYSITSLSNIKNHNFI